MAGIALVSILVEIGYTDTEELSPHAHCKGVGGLVLELAMSVRQWHKIRSSSWVFHLCLEDGKPWNKECMIYTEITDLA